MRSEYKMILAGFGAGAVVGVLALTSGNASIDPVQARRGDRIVQAVKPPVAYGDLDPALIVSHVELTGPKGVTVEFRDHTGRIVYRSDPDSHTTTVAKNTVIPSFSVLGDTSNQATLKQAKARATDAEAVH